ncbi:MAG: hypothetical protein U9N49_01810 [Campylobacterota bacterium]|nr:hypothetical protein [Campylobacterota bacterium]
MKQLCELVLVSPFEELVAFEGTYEECVSKMIFYTGDDLEQVFIGYQTYYEIRFFD